MFRLTLTLLAATAVTLSVAGQPIEAETEIDVAKAKTDLTDATPGVLALDDEVGAIERAIQATQQRASLTQAEVAPVQLVSNDPMAGVEQALPRATVNASRVNLRAGPSTANNVVDQVVRNQVVKVLDTTDTGWARIEVVETGAEAWIFDRFITTQG